MPDLTDEISFAPVGPFFRFPNESVGMAALRIAGLLSVNEDGQEVFITASHSHCLDVLGTITRGGEWDDEGNEITPPTTLDGWHVNYQGELPEGWEQYAVEPKQPVRVWS
jgi:hypothetical protein